MTGTDDGRIVLRSYRLAFELERRIHRIDRYRIPLPYGLPLVAAGYGLATAVLVVVLSGAPVVGVVLGMLPWPIRLLFIPGLVAHLLCRPTGDGRPAHEAVAARAAAALAPGRQVAFSRAPRAPREGFGPVVVVTDERGAQYRAAKVTGPGSVLLRRPLRGTFRRRALHVEQLDGPPLTEPQVVHLRADEQLVLQ